MLPLSRQHTVGSQVSRPEDTGIFLVEISKGQCLEEQTSDYARATAGNGELHNTDITPHW